MNKFLSDASWNDREEVRRHINEIENPEALRVYSVSGNDLERENVAAHPLTPPECLKELGLYDVIPEIRTAAVGNPKFPQEAMEKAALDPNLFVRAALFGNPACPNYIKTALPRIDNLYRNIRANKEESNIKPEDILQSVKRGYTAMGTIELPKEKAKKEKSVSPSLER